MKILLLALDKIANSPRPDRVISYLNSNCFYPHVWALSAPKQERKLSSFRLLRRSLSTNPVLSRFLTLLFLVVWRICPTRRLFEYVSELRYGIRKLPDKERTEEFDLVWIESIWLLPIAFVLNARVTIFDAREHFLSQRNDSLIFRIFEKPILSRICNNYLRRVDFLYTVSSGLSNLYRRDYEVCMRVVHSTPSLNPLIYPHPAHFPFRLVHHGVANRNRSLEQLIYIARALPEMVVLSFFLTGDQNEIKRLKTIADEMPNVEFCSPVPMTDIVQTMNNYDLGLVYWPPTTENLINSAPNKFFEYLHAGVAVVCAPLPSIAPIVDEYDCGIMAESFDRDSVVSLIKNLSAADITRMKYNARKAAEKYSFENESIVFEEFLKRTASYKKSNSE